MLKYYQKQEDYDNGLFNIVTALCNKLTNAITKSIDETRHGENNFKLNTNGRVTNWTISKDVYNGTQHSTDHIDVQIGDEYSCLNYEAFLDFYNSLSKLDVKKLSNSDVRKLLLQKNK